MTGPANAAGAEWENEGGAQSGSAANSLPEGITMRMVPEYRVGPYRYDNLSLAIAERDRQRGGGGSIASASASGSGGSASQPDHPHSQDPARPQAPVAGTYMWLGAQDDTDHRN